VNIYESDKLLSEYISFHYGTDENLPETLSKSIGAQNYPLRCVHQLIRPALLPPHSRALDLGCAVGRSTFELARFSAKVIGIDFSQRFITTANQFKELGHLNYQRTDEGSLASPYFAAVHPEIDRSRVSFEVGDAMNLRPDLGSFDVVLMANLIDRLSEPLQCLQRLTDLVNPGGQLIITSPYTWLEEFTPRSNWLGGFTHESTPITTKAGLLTALSPSFELISTQDLPFIIREHARKFQWSIAEASIWTRRQPTS